MIRKYPTRRKKYSKQCEQIVFFLFLLSSDSASFIFLCEFYVSYSSYFTIIFTRSSKFFRTFIFHLLWSQLYMFFSVDYFGFLSKVIRAEMNHVLHLTCPIFIIKQSNIQFQVYVRNNQYNYRPNYLQRPMISYQLQQISIVLPWYGLLLQISNWRFE